MEFDFTRMDRNDCYKLLCGAVVPRPIALVTTISPDGVPNAAAFSFFNVMGYDPPIVALGIEARVGTPAEAGAVAKDTAANIRATGEFVVHLVDEAIAEAMNIASIDFPPEVDELAVAGFEKVPSLQVKPPRIAEAPVAMECRRYVTIEIGHGRNVVLGEVVQMHVRDDLVDPARFHVAGDKSGLIGRMHGNGWYARTGDLFQMPRLSVAEWERRKAGG
jgi:flavin reductase (DIM6/NTAB) family NADH-FMN oxidoreductase RutF